MDSKVSNQSDVVSEQQSARPREASPAHQCFSRLVRLFQRLLALLEEHDFLCALADCTCMLVDSMHLACRSACAE